MSILPNFYLCIIGFTVTFCISLLLVFTKHLHGKLTLDVSTGVQKFHDAPTPRVGGVALVIGYFAIWFALPPETHNIWGLVGIAGAPAFVFGLAEDITKQVSVRRRLLATIAAGLLFSTLTGYTITKVDVVGLDALLTFSAASIMFTALAIGGVANAINLIDGFHGLASGTLILILCAFALVGWRVGDEMIVTISLGMAGILAGFFVVNFPFGKLFLGDAGAYFSGYMVAVLAVMLPARNPEVSPWVSLLILGYPITETMVSIVRRLFGAGQHPGQPDCAHLHHIIHRSVAYVVAERLHRPVTQNALTSVFTWIFPIITLITVSYCDLGAVNAMAFLSIIVIAYLGFYRGVGTAKPSGMHV